MLDRLLPDAEWVEGAEFEVEGVPVTVRIVRDDQLRFWRHSIGHVGDAGDHKANNVPYPDIMSYTPQSHTKCVSTLDVESLALRMSRFLLPAPLVANHASGPGPLGNPFVYQVTFTTDHNNVGQEYALQYTYETDPFGDLFPEDKFRLYVHIGPNAAGVQSICLVEADLSQSVFDLDTFQPVWIVSLAEFDHNTRTAQGDCGMSTVREGRGLQAGDVLTNIQGSATGKVGVIQFGDLQDTTEVPDYTIQSGSAAGPVVTALSPAAGSSEGGTLVTVSGTGFQSGATVTFGSTPATGVQFVAPDQLTATTPAHAAGTVDVTVTNPDGQASTLAGGFTF